MKMTTIVMTEMEMEMEMEMDSCYTISDPKPIHAQIIPMTITSNDRIEK